MMEEKKQLNINQPIPSVRRFLFLKKDQKKKTDNFYTPNNIPPLPSDNSEFKSGPITKPGTVPFIWEQSPGRPKRENTPENEWPEMDPMLPPGKISIAKKQEEYDKKKFTKFASPEDDTIEEESDSGDGNEADLETVDSLLQNESFSLNCTSVSGVSRTDARDLKRSGISSTDQLTQDLMIGRFLLAANAMAAEPPQYSQLRETEKEIENDNKKSPVRDGAHIVPDLENDNKKSPVRDRAHIVLDFTQEIEEQESNDDYDKRPKSPLKVCGILPRFCFLNPIPGKNRVPMSPPVHRTQRFIYSKRKGSLDIHGEANNDDNSGSAIVEKTLYVDTIHKVESPKQNPFSPNMKGKPSLRKNDFKILAKSERIKETHLVDSCKDTDCSNIVEEEVLKNQSNGKGNQELGVDEELSQDLIDLENKREDRFISLELPVPPPLPKSPTDSWLCRTLTSTSSKNMSVWSKTTAGDLELKTNAETTKVQTSNLRFLEEPLTPIPEND